MLRVKSLSKDFRMHIREGLLIEGFHDISLEVPEGRLLAVTGESGAGKSTLLKCIYRTYRPSSGEVLYTREDGTVMDIVTASDREVLSLRREEMGYVSQFLSVIPRISALEILRTRLSQKNAENPERYARELLRRVRLPEELWNMYPSTFSGGEKQRLNILLALAGRPRFLLLDEPTASLDQNSKEIIYEMILDAKKKGTTMMGVFHDREAIEKLADDEFRVRAHGGEYVGRGLNQ